MFDIKTAYWTGASGLSDCVLLAFLKKMHGAETCRKSLSALLVADSLKILFL